MKHLENLQSLSPEDLLEILRVSSTLKKMTQQGKRPSLLSNYCLSPLFEKPSLRTRLSFDVAMTQLGGTSLFFTAADVGLNGRESLADVARVITRFTDVLVIRAFPRTSSPSSRATPPAPSSTASPTSAIPVRPSPTS